MWTDWFVVVVVVVVDVDVVAGRVCLKESTEIVNASQ